MKSTNREKKYENLEDEKKKLFEELTEEILNSQDKKKISNLETENEELKKYVHFKSWKWFIFSNVQLQVSECICC